MLSPGVGEDLRADASQYEGRALESAQGHPASRAAAANTSPLRGGKLLARAHSDADYHNAHEHKKNDNARWYLLCSTMLETFALITVKKNRRRHPQPEGQRRKTT